MKPVDLGWWRFYWRWNNARYPKPLDGQSKYVPLNLMSKACAMDMPKRLYPERHNLPSKRVEIELYPDLKRYPWR